MKFFPHYKIVENFQRKTIRKTALMYRNKKRKLLLCTEIKTKLKILLTKKNKLGLIKLYEHLKKKYFCANSSFHKITNCFAFYQSI